MRDLNVEEINSVSGGTQDIYPHDLLEGNDRQVFRNIKHGTDAPIIIPGRSKN